MSEEFNATTICIVCGAEADYEDDGYGSGYSNRICFWCADNLPGGIVDMADGKSIYMNIPEDSNYLRKGLWTKDNWQDYPLVIERRKEVGFVAAQKIDKSNYPHTCIRCGSPSFNGIFSIDCSNPKCR